jgi:peptide deformylase
MSNFLLPNDIRLNEPSAEVPISEIPSKEIQDLIDRMFEISGGNRKDGGKGVLVGLAAPQIGVFKQVILVALGTNTKERDFGKLITYINPRILEKSSEVALNLEGCFSVDCHLCGIVPRSEWIKIAAYDREGNAIKEEYSGIDARILQHEIDHLEGKRFPDSVGPQGKLHWVEPEQFPDYRINWATWTVTFPWEGWIAMKAGRPFTAPLVEPQKK